VHQVAVGTVQGVYRYPVKSMAGQSLAAAQLGWHGIEGDRRYAFLREDQKGGLPWLTAGRLPSLVLYRPHAAEPRSAGDATHVTTPTGAILELEGEALREELSRAFGASVRLMRLDHGMFDEAPLSLISTASIATIAAGAGRGLDVRRFRPNILMEAASGQPFPEEAWLGGRLRFGDGEDAPVMSVTRRDVRCTMVGLDPDTAVAAPEVLKATVRINETCAGVYGSTLRTGPVAVGAPVYLLGEGAS
jgi:MOSC domain-containing protein